ncbi:MAG: DUF4325 domain-containing protein [Deltaproteobacteria bacterium]|nr:DUF4325 domain-containing protein [Deltaproteobacteria bacterium]
MLNRNSKPKSVAVKELFGTTVSTRQAVQEFAKYVPSKTSKVVIDFDEVEFVSRSFAHEFLRFQKTHPAVEIQNCSKDVKKMFDTVRRSSSSAYSDEDITDSSINLADLSLHF